MDEKVAEVANLTLRMREMSGKVMWHESQQDEMAASIAQHKLRAEQAEARVRDVELKGVSKQFSSVFLQDAFTELLLNICAG